MNMMQLANIRANMSDEGSVDARYINDYDHGNNYRMAEVPSQPLLYQQRMLD